MPDPDPLTLKNAEKRVLFCQKNLGDPSEMALLSRLHWWTVEYGMIGTLENPKIYGAGLLSSIGESKSCMDPSVKKYWYTEDAVNFPFDITKPQPQLFVTPDFKNLTKVLENFADTMAFRIGGSESILKAIECRNTCTAVYSSGLQVSGVFSDLRMDKNDELLFLKTNGSTALSFENKQLEGHGKQTHSDGFSSPVGRLKNFGKALEDANEEELEKLGIVYGNRAELNFLGGLRLKGMVSSILKRNSKLILISFTDCTLQDEQQNIYFEPSWGVYDMAVGEKIVSVYSGAADKNAFEEIPQKAKSETFHPEYTEHQKRYHDLFRQVRLCRETQNDFNRLTEIWTALKEDFRDDWLCAMEILEILELGSIYKDLAREIRIYLEMKASNEPELKKIIQNGFYLISKSHKL
jgi:phenylalanine-4-hydroxylase